MKKLIFVTSNENKFSEAQEILGELVQRRHDLDELQSLSLKEVVEHKARQAYKIYHQPVIVDDVSLEVKGLNNLPGTMIKWFEKLLTDGQGRMDPKTKDRSTSYRVAYGYYDKNGFKYFEGINSGKIAKKPRGSQGWGFDVIFIPKGEQKTFAQLGPKWKNKNSARYLALEKLRKFLQKNKSDYPPHFNS